ncbi:LptM family lipoprotein [Sediminicoccus sp. BL-A-41-H5]|uniref:LptM family lipoprotein n=1 Tax=Sediminicoccus sp. BL-A-41-H5 TaxID=3421106 RepID=UPI003D6724D2
MRKMFRWSFVIVLAGGLAACGQTTGDRALSGAGLGAAAGAGVGALTGTSVVGGAALGAAAGGATGALTSPNTVNLGRPAWR